MITSTMVLGDLDSHPVHRATALLRQALLSSSASPPDPAEIWDDSALGVTSGPIGLAYRPVSITYPTSFEAFSPIDNQTISCQPLVTQANDVAAAAASHESASEGDDMLDAAAQLQLKGLVEAFYRRQRQASLIVACSVAAAFALTFGGIVLLFSVSEPVPASRQDPEPQKVTSLAHAAAGSETAPAFLGHLRVQSNKSAKTAPLLIRAKAEGDMPHPTQSTSEARVVHTTPGRPLALAPLLPVGSAGYLLLRGLPDDAELSAGRRTSPGAWMVKGADLPSLTLTVDPGTNGDYPFEVYLLGAKNGLQARHRLVLRIDQALAKVYAAGLGLGWSTAFAQAPNASEAEPDVSGSSTKTAARERVQRLLGEGDIAAARHLLTGLAERGEADAAYELALTYDDEVLAKAGVEGIEGNLDTARAWYEQAAREGHTGAVQRLQMLARPRDGA
jgi:hypothetical protein